MKKIFKCGLIVAGMLALATIGMTAVNTPTPVYAAQKIYGMGKMYTIPKSLRGTWYSKSRKVRITAHTYNGKTVYHQNTKAIPERIWNPSNKAQMREQNRLIHATRNKLAGYYTNRAGGKYFTVAPWIGFEEWDMFKAKTMKVNGKTVKYLDYSNGYTGTKFFKSRSLARKY